MRSAWISMTMLLFYVLSGFVPLAQAQQPYRLTLREAIQLGLKANLSVLVSETKAAEAAGTRERRFSNLLPKSHVETSLALQKVNLSYLGINIPGAPPVIGPFSTYDFRIYVDQSVLDLQAFRNWKSSEEHERATRSDYQDSRDLVIRAVASLYLNAESAAALVDSAESRVTTSQALLKLANDQHESGVATGLDVVRARVQLADDQQAVLTARSAAKQTRLVLARNIGLSLATPLELAEKLSFRVVQPPEITEAVSAAVAERPDYISLLRQRDEQMELQRASRARFLPRISLSGNYGGNGRTLSGIASTGTVEGSLSLTIFDRDREGEQVEIDRRLQRVNSQLADLRLQIEEDIREALLNLESSSNQVQVAQEELTLAQQELDLARVRFQAGAANNVEVVTAQDSLTRAQQNQVGALTKYIDAKIALARALGGTEKNYGRYLEQ